VHGPRRLVFAALALTLLACAQLADVPLLQPTDLTFDPAQSTKLYDSGDRLITKLYGTQDRTVVALSDVAPVARQAVIAIEDRRFWQHGGVDLKAIVRAAAENLASGEVEQGGSTITQQLVRNTLLSRQRRSEKTIDRKIDEIALARQLEARLEKKEILERYLNTVYFGRGAYGIETAAHEFFGKSAGQLKLPEAALLAGLIRSPEMYAPDGNEKRSIDRRNTVLRAMASFGFISKEKARRAAQRPWGLAHHSPPTPYPAPYFIDYVSRLLIYDPRFAFLGATPKERRHRLTRDGLHVYTTLDSEMQAEAESAIAGVLTEAEDPHGALVAMDPKNGYVRALVGGRNYFATRREDGYAKLNLALVGEPNLGTESAPGTGRQAGSAFKPFALAAAIDDGISLEETYSAEPCMTFPGANAGGPWRVCNYEEDAFGTIPLLEATVNSVNVVYAQLILDVGAGEVVETARRLGINTPLSEVPSAALGSNPVNALGMASAYGSFATNGMHHSPVAIRKITDASGKVLYENKTTPTRVMEASTAYLVSGALEQVIERGTGTGAQIGRPTAGKTGTAQEYRDAWFVGYTPQLVTAVWVGYPQGSIEMKTYCETSDPDVCQPTRLTVTGGTWPASIWQAFMTAALSGVPVEDFTVPEGAYVKVTIDVRTGCLADEFTPEEYAVEKRFVIGTEPTSTCALPEPKDKDKNEDKDGGGDGDGGGGNGNEGHGND
jgi:penicillin-binding protein 1A